MKYPPSHWNTVADLHRKGLTPAQIQDHYPHTTVKTVQRWIRKCRQLGLID